jgi:glucokinase
MESVTDPVPARLVGDIGATNARFALADKQSNVRLERSYRCAEFPGLADVVRHYFDDLGLAPADRPREAALAIAAPLHGDLVSATNLNWTFSAAATRVELGLQRLLLLNDFTALALSLRALTAAGRVQVGGGKPRANASIALLGPGSGLGASGLLHAGRRWYPIMGEGGHATLPASTAREAAVVQFLRQEYSHVSAERILSGPGLYQLYQTLCTLDGVSRNVANVESVTEHALAGLDPQCVEAVQMFCEFLGTAASDLTLTLGAHGGCYIGGGIVPRLMPIFPRSGFRARFEDKGRFRAYLEPIPVYVITAGHAALTGCARAFSQPAPHIDAA